MMYNDASDNNREQDAKRRGGGRKETVLATDLLGSSGRELCRGKKRYRQRLARRTGVGRREERMWEGGRLRRKQRHVLVTDLVPSEMACLASSPGRMRRTAVWISREEMVDFLEYAASSARTRQFQRHVASKKRKKNVLEASVAMRSKISLTNELRMAMALFEIPVSGWTCLRTERGELSSQFRVMQVD